MSWHLSRPSLGGKWALYRVSQSYVYAKFSIFEYHSLAPPVPVFINIALHRAINAFLTLILASYPTSIVPKAMR